ncbi:MAG: peptidoglycan DD-metalloendopeptidase family protein [Synergistaceae bacterium]|nr:peptidoglycan DD-metalloendopeptidase family protein [Synergistaceae bacterium]
MKKQIQKYNAIAKEKSKQSKTLLSQLSRLKQNANSSEEQIETLEKENRRLAASVNKLNKDIDRANASMAIIMDNLQGRLLDMYKFTPDENSVSIILNAQGPHEAVNTAYMLRRFARQDAEILEALNRKEHELITARKQLEADKAKIVKQTTELKKKRAEFDSTIQKTDTLLKNVQSEQKKAESAAKELQNAQKAVGNKINTLMKQKTSKKAKANTKTQTRITTAKVTTVQGTKAAVPVKTTSVVPAGGVRSLSWPLRGTITMEYGSRVHPTFKTKIFNSGIDIKAASGTAVKAAGPGEVLYQGWLRGFGQVVIIDHGGDITTVYAHLGGASVREGAAVKTGTVIGKVGNTGTDSEYGLHFEVRKNGSAVNPMNFLR